jgi:hypothetical protein
MRGKIGEESRRPTIPIPARLGSLVAGVFRYPNVFPRYVMVRSEQWWRRLPVELRSQERGRLARSPLSRHSYPPLHPLTKTTGDHHFPRTS